MKHIKLINEFTKNEKMNLFNSKLSIEDVKREIEIKWDIEGREGKLVDFFEDHISDYKNKMNSKEYDVLRDMIIFDWGDLGNDITPEYI